LKRLLLLFLLAVAPLYAQVAVAPLQLVRQQFLSATGVPLAAGCVNFFATGTSTPQAIYADSTGTFQLANPLTLDAAGEASVWMTNTGYDIVANTGVSGQLCSVALGTQLWRENNKNPYSIINGGSNYIVASGTVDPGGIAGMLAYRTDIPCFRGFTTIWDCFAQLNAVQTLTNKTLVNPIISSSTGAVLTSPNINGTVVTGPPATYLVMTNNVTTGTTLNKLAKIDPSGLAGFALIASAGDTGGVTGIVVAGAGNTGNATIQQNGSASCVFDNAVTAGNYVQISSSVAGDCHDSGIAPPSLPVSGGQVIGRLLATNASAGTYIIDLFGPEIRIASAASVGCTAIGPVTVTNSVATTTLLSCSIPANTLAAGNEMVADLTGLASIASNMTIQFTVNVGAGTACSNAVPAVSTAVNNNQPYLFFGKFSVLTAGAGGTANWSCGLTGSTAVGVFGSAGTVGAPTIAINTTISNTLLVTVTMSVANVGNSVTGQLLKAVIF